jgi:hypothetical protein
MALPLLKRACADLQYLVDRDYNDKSAVAFVGNHYQYYNPGSGVIAGNYLAALHGPDDPRSFRASRDIPHHTGHLEAILVSNTDRELFGKENVVSSDSVVLDRCKSWLNAAPEITNYENPERKFIYLKDNL